MKNNLFVLILIVILAFILRFYRLGEVPLGFHQDEISQAYNSFSILKTGQDRYGQLLPILFRSFGSYQPPIYTYLTPIPLYLFGNTIFAARSTSAFFGVLIVLMSYFIVKELVKTKHKESLALLASFVVAISPWAIHFSRRVVEGNLGLFFFLLSFYFFIRSLSQIKFIIPASVLLAISTHAYYSERLIAVIFFPFFPIYFKDYFLKYKKWVIGSILLFGLILLPHVATVFSGAFAARLDQVGTAGEGKLFFVEFAKHFVNYLSPKYLFSDAGSGLARVSPDLGVFFNWMVVPFLIGLYFLTKYINNEYLIFLGIFLVICLVPVSMTGDIFYPLRALEFFWLLSFIISIGIFEIGERIKNVWIKWFIFFSLILYSLGFFYVSYFILFQHETTESAGNTYFTLSNKLDEYKDYKIILDSTRDPATGLRIAYVRSYDPKKLQALLKGQMESPYYDIFVNNNETYVVDNIEARAINWKSDRCRAKTILVGDALAISESQIKDHNLEKVFEIEGINRNIVLFGYLTNPDKKCETK
ncbi:MAG: glycosyl transferase family 39 [uncultured bacterium]|nr:MAG: glycosyl transferase family 39 [uncultured bacterium]